MSILETSPKRHSFNHSKSVSPAKRLIFNTRPTNISTSQSYLSKPTLSSSAKLNVVTTDWRSKSSTSVPTVPPVSPTRKTLKRASTADRFIPARHATSHKLYSDDTNLNPTDSPTKHIEFQSTKIYQHSVAQVCGISLNQKILKFQPPPPDRKRTIDLHSQFSTSLNDGLSNALVNSRLANGGIVPSTALARARKIPNIPERILDAPGLVDDYYLNLLAWSVNNLLAVALGNAVYIWLANVGSVTMLTECSSMITSLAWSDDGAYLSVGTDSGAVEVWDIEEGAKLRTMQASDARIASHGWSQHIVTTGGRSGEIVNHDVRVAAHVQSTLKAHNAEICGLQWRKDGNQLATGANDNLVNIWDARASVPLYTKNTHTAAVKAVSWCDNQYSLLATGGGSSDKCIHFWNTTTGARVNSISTGAQITSLNWGMSQGTGQEIVATNGFPKNSISVYSYPTLQKTGEIVNSHEARILYSARSPDGTTLATAAGDENLKFWKIFDVKNKQEEDSSLANGGKEIRRVMTLR